MVDSWLTWWLVGLTTYLVHSTILLGSLWLILRIQPARDYVLAEGLWKLAAMGGLITTFVQLGGWSVPIQIVEERPANSPVTGLPTSAGDPPIDYEQVALSRPLPLSDPRTGESLESGSLVLSGDGSTEIDPNLLVHSSRETAELAQHATPGGELTVVTSNNGSNAWGLHLDSWPLAGILLTMTLIASGLGAIWYVRQSRLLARWLAHCHPCDGPACQVLRRLLLRLGVDRPVELLYSKHESEPLAVGVWRWRIILPQGIDHRLNSADLEALLAHELAHLVRFDGLWVWIGRILCSVFAFQPMNFVARRHWMRAVEFRCDDWAITRGIATLSLARCLTEVAAWRGARMPLVWAMAAGGGQGHLTERVERLIEDHAGSPGNSSQRSYRWQVLIGLSVIVAVGCLGPRVHWQLAWAEDEEISSRDVIVSDQPFTAADDLAMEPLTALLAPREQLLGELMHLEQEMSELDEVRSNLVVRERQINVPDEVHRSTQMLVDRLEGLRERQRRLKSVLSRLDN